MPAGGTITITVAPISAPMIVVLVVRFPIIFVILVFVVLIILVIFLIRITYLCKVR